MQLGKAIKSKYKTDMGKLRYAYFVSVCVKHNTASYETFNINILSVIKVFYIKPYI